MVIISVEIGCDTLKMYTIIPKESIRERKPTRDKMELQIILDLSKEGRKMFFDTV